MPFKQDKSYAKSAEKVYEQCRKCKKWFSRFRSDDFNVKDAMFWKTKMKTK